MMFYLAIWEQVQGLLPEILGAICVLFAGSFWGKWRAQVAWRKKHFANRITLSLNSLGELETKNEEGEAVKKPFLQLRTLFENDLMEVFHNSSMITLVKKATTVVQKGEPVLHFDKGDSWHILNAILNQISERFAEGLLRKDMGLSVVSRRYIFCLTYELEDDVKTNKIRVMIMDKEKFLNFPDTGEVETVAENHQTRVKTLRTMKREYKNNPHLFMDMELVT